MRYHTSVITMRMLELAHESVSLAGKRSKMPGRKILQSKATDTATMCQGNVGKPEPCLKKAPIIEAAFHVHFNIKAEQ